MRVMQVELLDGRVVTVREPFAREMGEYRRSMSDFMAVRDMFNELKKSGKNWFDDERFDKLWTANVMDMAVKLCSLGEETRDLSAPDFLGVVIARAEVVPDFSQIGKKSSSGSTPTAEKNSPSGPTT